MGTRFFGLALSVSLATLAVVGDSETAVWGQGTVPTAPTPAGPTTSADEQDFLRSTEATDRNQLIPPASRSRRSSTSPVSTSRNRNNSPFSPRLVRSAPIMGDSVAPSLLFTDGAGSSTRQLPQGGGATRSKIAENSSSLPLDRFIFTYNHFHNAINENLTDASNIDRFTAGFERTFFDQMASVELRMPFSVDNDYTLPGNFGRNGSEVGNLSVTLKSVLTSDANSLFSAGLTIDTPTGGGTLLTVDLANDLSVDISNDAVHLSPFLGFLCAGDSGNTHQGFIQVDVPTNANGVVFTNITGPAGTTTTELLEQTLLYIDYQYARELYNAGRSSRGGGVQRILGLAEMHYTTTLEDSDVVVANTPGNLTRDLSSFGNRIDVVNLTFGLHTEFSGGTQLRLGTVAPITNGDDRFFDFEFQAQMNVPLW